MKKIDQSIWVFQLPSGLEVRLVNVPQEDLDFLDGIDQLREQVAAQAAVIEKLRVAYVALENFAQTVGGSSSFWEDMNDVLEPASCIANFNTDSTQILDEVRKQERERCSLAITHAWHKDPCYLRDLTDAIRAME